MKLKLKFWLRFSIINLFLVALLGTLMRYKMGFDFTIFDLKHLLHSHSHFAFAGWISHSLMVLMIFYLTNKIPHLQLQKYTRLVVLNLISAYGMLVLFIIQGYAFGSIVFSTLSIIISYFFAYFFIKDLKKTPKTTTNNWFKGALIFYVLSSVGTFFLAYAVATDKGNYEPYQASIYFYLHFQYNGWFIFACLGLLADFLQLNKLENSLFNRAYKWLFLSTLITYLLSILWLDIPDWAYAVTVVFAVIQLVVWCGLALLIIRNKKTLLKKHPLFLQYFLVISGICLTLKFLLQLLSAIPDLSAIVFGLHALIIAYLHLVLLAVISIFLLYYIFANKLLSVNPISKVGLIGFVIGIFLNELILSLQSLSILGYIFVPKTNEMLFVAALIMLLSTSIIISGIYKKKALN